MVQRLRVNSSMKPAEDGTDADYDYYYLYDRVPLKRRFCSLPEGPYLSRLARLSLSENAFSAVPPAVMGATALEFLDLARQNLPLESAYYLGFLNQAWPRIQGLHLLHSLPRLSCVRLMHFEQNDDGIRTFQAAHPHVVLDWEWI